MNGYYEDLIARLRSETDTLSVALLHEAADALEEKIQTEKELRAALDDLINGQPSEERLFSATVAVKVEMDDVREMVDEIKDLQTYKLSANDDLVLISRSAVADILLAHVTIEA